MHDSDFLSKISSRINTTRLGYVEHSFLRNMRYHETNLIHMCRQHNLDLCIRIYNTYHIGNFIRVDLIRKSSCILYNFSLNLFLKAGN